VFGLYTSLRLKLGRWLACVCLYVCVCVCVCERLTFDKTITIAKEARLSIS
jgi:hypothetical protein